MLCDNGTDLCGWWRTEFLVSLWDPNSRALSTAVSRRSSMPWSMFSLSWSTAAYAQTNAKTYIKKLVFCFWIKKNQSTITRFHFGLQYKPPRVVTLVTHSCCSKRPWDVDISLQRHRNVAHAKPNIHPPLSLCKITPRSVGKIGKPSLSCSDCLVTPEYITVYFTLMHEEEHYPKSKWVVWFRLSHLIKGLKSN